ncbi:MAG: RdgB/HAM1 family non-canonical purine NTP pyrophosphatase [Clostridia bacterium]|nr:RdgB/HAM1 family non-canonical purine NTP pyrophosphatase [Clostridia bacterium]
MEIVIASRNQHKITELQALLSRYVEGVKLLSLDDVGFEGDIEEDGTTFAENALIKARAAAASGKIGVGDDSGLCVNALGGAPGIFSARFAGVHGDDGANNERLLRELSDKEDRSAAFVCTIACVMPDGREFVVEGRAEGSILHSASGKNGFGYDPLFYYAPLEKSFATLSAKEKNEISHRARAVAAFAEKLTDFIK